MHFYYTSFCWSQANWMNGQTVISAYIFIPHNRKAEPFRFPSGLRAAAESNVLIYFVAFKCDCRAKNRDGETKRSTQTKWAHAATEGSLLAAIAAFTGAMNAKKHCKRIRQADQ